MLLALVVATTLEAGATPSPAVELTRAGTTAASVSAAPRSLSDVARELREGRKATGGFSAVETTVRREPVDLRFVSWDEEEDRNEPEVVPEPQPPGVSNEIYGWGGGGWGPVASPRRPHVSHHGSSLGRHQARAVLQRGAAPAPAARPGASRSSAVPLLPHAGSLAAHRERRPPSGLSPPSLQILSSALPSCVISSQSNQTG